MTAPKIKYADHRDLLGFAEIIHIDAEIIHIDYEPNFVNSYIHFETWGDFKCQVVKIVDF